MKELNQNQLLILKRILFSDGMKFSELRPENMENNLFVFHLEKLIQLNLIEKKEAIYSLTTLGKEYSNQIDRDVIQLTEQAKQTVLICPTRKRANEIEFLLHTRSKQPFFGCQMLISGKLKRGEKIYECAKRELLEETNLTGDPILVNVKHYLFYDKNKKLIDDRFFHTFKIDSPHGELTDSEEGKSTWVKENEIEDFLTNPVISKNDLISRIIEVKDFNGTINFIEKDIIAENF